MGNATDDDPKTSATRHVAPAVEWPTVLVAGLCWSGFVAVLVGHDRVPGLVVVVALGVSGAWYMSLQHEVIHGHPTPWHALNVAMASAPLSLWSPFAIYRDSHLDHHRGAIAVPGRDPESFLVDAATWSSASRLRRRLLTVNQTFVGRLVLGPILGAEAMARRELAAVTRSRAARRVWLRHVFAAALTGWIVFGVAGVPVWQYLLGYVYLGMSLTSVRSFAEHRAVDGDATRSAVVTSGRMFGVLFLFNNLHHTHHARPAAPWYRLPSLTTSLDAVSAAASGAGWYRGYGEIARRHAFRPIASPVAPSTPAASVPMEQRAG